MSRGANPVLGRRVRRAREAAGLSLRQLAAKANVNFSVISRMENATGDVWFSSVAAIAETLDLSLDALVAPSACLACDGMPPAGFTCNACGTG